MLKPIFDRQISRKRSAPEDDGPYDRSALPLNCHRPVNNGADFNINILVPTVQLGYNAIGSLPPLAWRTENQDGYLKPSNNINSARRNRCNIESNFYPPPHDHYHHHDRPVQTTISEFNHNRGLRKVDDRPTRYLLQHNNGPRDLRYGGPPNRPYQQEQFDGQQNRFPSPVKNYNHPTHISTMHVSSTAIPSEHREKFPTSHREFLRCLANNTESTNTNVLEYQRFENRFVDLMMAHREYILNGIIHMVMCMKMTSPVQREASIHLIWCFVLNMIYNGCIHQKLRFTNIKSMLKFIYVFPRAHERFDLKRAIDNMDTFFKNIQSRFNLNRTFRSVSVPRCIFTLLHMCVYQDPAVMQDNKLVSGPGVNAFISLVSANFNSNTVPIIIYHDLVNVPDCLSLECDKR